MINLNQPQPLRPDAALRRGKALRQVARAPLWLRVVQGRVWVTRDGRPGRAPDDLVLEPGALLPLARGEGVVVEAFEDSRLEWLLPSPR